MRSRPNQMPDRPNPRSTLPNIHAACSIVRTEGGVMTGDVLSDVLRAIRLTGAVYFDFELTSPWVAEAPPATELSQYRDAGLRSADRVPRHRAWLVLGTPGWRRTHPAARGRHSRVPAGRSARALELPGHAGRAGHERVRAAPRAIAAGSSRRVAAAPTGRAWSAVFSVATIGRSIRCWRLCRTSCTCPRHRVRRCPGCGRCSRRRSTNRGRPARDPKMCWRACRS